MKISDMIIGSARAIGFESYDTVNYINFNDRFHEWIHSSEQVVSGLPINRYLVNGITDAFNQTYGLYNRIGIFDGEYEYHQKIFGTDRVTTDLHNADIIIVSHPFSADGMCSHHKLAIADNYNIPIFVDCAFFGICQNINFDFTKYKNIHSVCFSLSKAYGTGYRRVGLLYTTDNYPVCLYGEWQYPFISSVEYHQYLLGKIGPDDIPKQYRNTQLEVCTGLGVTPSNTVIFGLDYTDRYNHLKRGSVNRLCLTNIYERLDKQKRDRNTLL
jgi:hypothetical protein